MDTRPTSVQADDPRRSSTDGTRYASILPDEVELVELSGAPPRRSRGWLFVVAVVAMSATMLVGLASVGIISVGPRATKGGPPASDASAAAPSDASPGAMGQASTAPPPAADVATSVPPDALPLPTAAVAGLPAEASAPAPAATQAIIEAPPPETHRVVVRAGDMLSGIARDHGLPLQVVLDANPQIADPKLLRPGDTVLIPHVTILADFVMAPVDRRQPTGHVEAVIHSPTDWSEVPGTFHFEGAPGSELRAIQGVVEQVEHWYDPGFPEPGSGGANVAVVLGHECDYWVSRQPVCRDINWTFVDVLGATYTDGFRWCTWTDGRRPPFPDDNNDWCANGRAGTESQDFALTSGSLKVVFNE